MTDELLVALHDSWVSLPGFVDVHRWVDTPDRYVGWFEPGAALPVDDALPVPDGVSLELRHVPVAMAPSTSGATLAEPTTVDPPLVPGPCSNQRPGGRIGACTMAWQLRDDNGALYVATAGHCIPNVGAAFSFGTAVYKAADGIGADFGLVRVHDHLATGFDPAMCHWGGPTTMAGDDDGGLGSVLRLYGHGIGFDASDLTRPRSGVLVSVGMNSFTYTGPVLAGDSGAPIRLDDGAALGVHTHGFNGVGPATVPIGTPTVKWGMRLDAGVAMAEAELGIDLTLVTAPLA